MQILVEGKAKFYASVDKAGKISKELDVFYNPAMKFNRDVTILLINSLNMKNMQIADILAGSGVRSLRLLKEISKGIIKNITVNDNDEGFDNLFKKELKLNKIRFDKNINIKNIDANLLLMGSEGFDFIDIDPFGSPIDFLEASVARLSRHGIIAVTATDTAPLSGTYPQACNRKYWAKPIHNHLMHEAGLRILIRRIQLIGASHDKALVPIYSYFKDHYFRVFLKCEKSKSAVDNILIQHRYLLFCDNCLSFDSTDVNTGDCICNSKMKPYGPMWTGNLYDAGLAQKISKSNKDKSNSHFLMMLSDESMNDIFGFHDIHALSKKNKMNIPRFDVLMKKILENNNVTRTHFTPLGLRADISVREMVKLMKTSL